MAQPVITGAIVRCRFVWEWAGRHVYVCRTFRVSPRPPGFTTLHCAYLGDALFAPVICNVIGGQWNYVGTWCRSLLPAWNGSADETVNNGPYPTLPAGEPLPAQICPLLLLRRGVNSFRSPGKMFLPSPTFQESNNGLPTAGYLASLAAVATYFETGHSMVVPGFATAGGLTACVGVFTPTANTLVSSIAVVPFFATQRRRAGVSKAPTPAPFNSIGVS